MPGPIDIEASFASVNGSNQAHATAYGALIILLIDKGVITQQEYERAYIQAQHVVSREFARKRDEAQNNEKKRGHDG